MDQKSAERLATEAGILVASLRMAPMPQPTLGAPIVQCVIDGGKPGIVTHLVSGFLFLLFLLMELAGFALLMSPNANTNIIGGLLMIAGFLSAILSSLVHIEARLKWK